MTTLTALAPLAAAAEGQDKLGGPFDLIAGLPLHPLIVHLPVVALPVAALMIIAAVFVRPFRRRFGVATFVVLAAGALGGLVAKESGEALAARVGEPEDHTQWADALVVVAAVSVLVVAVWLVLDARSRRAGARDIVAGGRGAPRTPGSSSTGTARPGAAAIAFSVASLLAALGLVVTIIGTGHSGAEAAWADEVSGPAATGSAAAADGEASGDASVTSSPAASEASYTMSDVAAHDSESSCWAVVGGTVYDLTDWIANHPGGPQRILALCGTDASAAFEAQHSGQGEPQDRLASFAIGTLD